MRLVSVLIITFNHERYIGEALDSIITQRVNFDFEIVIGEDFSTDGTRYVCEKYAAEYPDLIRLLPSDKNYGAVENEVRTLRACMGKYIAMCEGDDFWIDRNKLQRQVDFLEANPDFSICLTDVQVFNELDSDFKPDGTSPEFFRTGDQHSTVVPRHMLDDDRLKNGYKLEDLIDLRFNSFTVHTATLVFRNSLTFPLPDFYYKTFTTDYALFLLLGSTGKIKYFNDATAAYRVHGGGLTQSAEYQLKSHRKQFDMFDSFNEYTNFKYNESIKKLLFPASKTLLIYESGFLKGKERWEHIFRMIRGYNRYRDGFNVKEIAYYNVVLFFPFVIRMLRMLKSGGSTQAKAETK